MSIVSKEIKVQNGYFSEALAGDFLLPDRRRRSA